MQYRYLALYIIAITGISFIRIGDDNIFVVISTHLSHAIPSIKLISESTENVNSAKIMLSIAWISILPCSFFAIKSTTITAKSLSSFEHVILEKIGTKNKYLAYGIILTIAAALLAVLVIGNPLGGHSRRRVALTKIVSMHTAFLSIYAVGVTIAVSAFFVFVYLCFKSMRRKT